MNYKIFMNYISLKIFDFFPSKIWERCIRDKIKVKQVLKGE